MSVVGYQDADATNPMGYFIVKNSWGTGWGEAGYFRIGYSQVGNCVGFGGSTLAYSKTSCNGTVSVTSPASDDLAGGNDPDHHLGRHRKYRPVREDRSLPGREASSGPSSPMRLLADGSYQWTVDSDLNGSEYSMSGFEHGLQLGLWHERRIHHQARRDF